MSNVRIPDVAVEIVVAGDAICRFDFHNTSRAPERWEITGAIYSRDARQAVRAVLLACLGELTNGAWENFDFAPEGGGTADDQLELPF